jgi:hypothetical protein
MEMQSHQGVLTFLRDLAHQEVSVVENSLDTDVLPQTRRQRPSSYQKLRLQDREASNSSLLRFKNLGQTFDCNIEVGRIP